MPELISILMPAKNAGKYLCTTLHSIIEQQYPHWELCVVNDHSEDDTAIILQEYAALDTRIRPYNNPGKGIIDALRYAYSHSKGKLITRMDADDIMKPNKLKFMAGALKKNGLGHLATGQVEYFSENQMGNGFLRYAEWLNELTAEGRNFEEIYKECVIPSPCWMIWRTDFEEIGAFEPDIYPEDYELCFRFLKKGLKVLPCSEVLHLWRDYPERASRTDPNYTDNRFTALKALYFKELHHDPDRPLVLWGAGPKGKAAAKEFIKLGVPFDWICNNPNKIGQDIYGVIMQPEHRLSELENPYLIMLISQNGSAGLLEKTSKGLKGGAAKILEDFCSFC